MDRTSEVEASRAGPVGPGQSGRARWRAEARARTYALSGPEVFVSVGRADARGESIESRSTARVTVLDVASRDVTVLVGLVGLAGPVLVVPVSGATLRGGHMFKTAAVIIVLAGGILLFQHQVKAWIYETRMESAIGRLDLASEHETRLVGLIDRVGDGYESQAFDALERSTLQSLNDEILDGGDAVWSSTDVQLLAGRYEAILRRHGL